MADAALVLDVASALRHWSERTGRQPATKVLREAVWFFWQNPRLDRPLIASKYPRSARWSEAAAALALSELSTKGELVIEHIEPMRRVLRWLIYESPSVTDVAEALPQRLQVVVVTREESKRLPDHGSPDERYGAAGLNLREFRPLNEWASVQPVRPSELADLDVGDVFWDHMDRVWTVLEVMPGGLKIDGDERGVQEMTWHALMTLGVRLSPQ